MLGSVLRRLLRRDVSRTRGAAVPAATSPLQEALRLHQAGRHADAEGLCRATLIDRPDGPDALNLLAAVLCAQGRSSEGIACLRRITQLEPAAAEAHANLATVLAATGDTDAAIEHYRRALALRPAHAECAERLARLLKALARYDDAEGCCRAAMAAGCDTAGLRHALANALFEQGRVDEAIAEARALVALDPELPSAHGDLARMLNYTDAESPLATWLAHQAWAERHASHLEAAAPPHRNDPGANRCLRVGYVSPYFHRHAVTFFLESMLPHHDRKQLDITLYSDVAQPDEYTRRLRSYGVTWRDTLKMNDERMAQAVRDDAMDILVDLSGQTPRNRLLMFARRPAPVQVTWVGYPNTTGLASMHYRITDEFCDPTGATEHFHSEQLVRLPAVYMSWRPPAEAPDVRPLPALESGRVTFGSFNSCYKLTPTLLKLWARILDRVPGSRLKVLAIDGDVAKRRIQDLLAGNGVDPQRIELVPRLSFEEFLAVHGEVDIALDAFPYHGTTTTCFSLWMGLPVVVRAGATHVSRVGVSMLSNVGLHRLIARNGDEYVDIATRLATDLPGLARTRAGMRDMMLRSPLTDGVGCARAVDAAFRTMWGEWCRRHSRA